VIVNREDVVVQGLSVPADDDEPIGRLEGRRVIRLGSQFSGRLIRARRGRPQPQRAAIAARFIADLQSAF